MKRLQVPEGWAAPTELIHEDLRAVALTRTHLADDVQGINASIDLIHRTRGGAWPLEPVSEDVDYVDLVWHECEFRDGGSYTYALYDSQQYLGCCYLYPMGGRTPLSPSKLHHDVDVSWWVTPDAYAEGRYEQVHRALRHWLVEKFPFAHPFYSNAQLPDTAAQDG